MTEEQQLAIELAAGAYEPPTPQESWAAVSFLLGVVLFVVWVWGMVE
jgi:hypothetical protein